MRLLRRTVTTYLVALIATGLAAFAVELLGVRLFVPVFVWLIPFGIPLTLTAAVMGVRRVRDTATAPEGWGWYLLAAILTFGVWAGVYFAIGYFTDPSRVRVLSGSFEARLPVVPPFAVSYLTVHPLFFLAYCLIDSREELRKLWLGNVAMLFVSATVWVLEPVELPRPAFSAARSIGEWTLRTIYAADPAINCLPSTHNAMALFAAVRVTRAHPKVGWVLVALAGLIGASTLLTRQHYLLDVLTGWALALATDQVIERRARHAGARATAVLASTLRP